MTLKPYWKSEKIHISLGDQQSHYLQDFQRPALQIRAGQQSITANTWPLTAHMYHVTIIVTSGFPKKPFLLLFPRNSFEQS